MRAARPGRQPLRPRRRGAGCAPADHVAQGRGQLHEGAPPAGDVDRDRRPRHRGRLLGLRALAAEPARTCVVALRGRAQRPHRAARPPLGHRLARGQLEGQRALGRDRARGLHVRARRASPTRSTTPRRGSRPGSRGARCCRSTGGTSSATANVPAPGGGWGGASHHTDPGPHWHWSRYLELVRRYAYRLREAEREPELRAGPLRGVVPWQVRQPAASRRVEFAGRRPRRWIDRRAPFSFLGGRGLNTTTLGNGRHVLELHGIAGPGRYDIARRRSCVDNKAFALTTAGARPGPRSAARSSSASGRGERRPRIVVRVDGDKLRGRLARLRLSPGTRGGAKPGKHVLQVARPPSTGVTPACESRSSSSNRHRRSRRRCPGPASRSPPRPGRRPAGGGARALARRCRPGPATRVEFWIDGRLRGTDLQRPFTLGWDTAAEAPGEHNIEARAFGAGRTASGAHRRGRLESRPRRGGRTRPRSWYQTPIRTAKRSPPEMGSTAARKRFSSTIVILAATAREERAAEQGGPEHLVVAALEAQLEDAGRRRQRTMKAIALDQRCTGFTQAGFSHGSLRKIHAAVKSWKTASAAATDASHAFMWIGSLKMRSKWLPGCLAGEGLREQAGEEREEREREQRREQPPWRALRPRCGERPVLPPPTSDRTFSRSSPRCSTCSGHEAPVAQHSHELRVELTRPGERHQPVDHPPGVVGARGEDEIGACTRRRASPSAARAGGAGSRASP